MEDKVGISMLRYSGIDIEGALARVCNNFGLYKDFLIKFVDDKTFDRMIENIKAKNFEDGYKDCHALKGVTGNLGFTQLYESCADLCKALKTGMLAPIAEACGNTINEYNNIIKIITELNKKPE